MFELQNMGFKFDLKVHFLGEDLMRTAGKTKFKSMFDIGVLSVDSANYMQDPKVNNIFKNAHFYLAIGYPF